MLLGYCQNALTQILGFKFIQKKLGAETVKYWKAYWIHIRALDVFYFLPFPHLPLK